MPHARLTRLLLFVIILAAAAGCRRATEPDCERIIDKIVELELKEQGITDPKLVEERKVATRAHKRAELLEGCVGKRISDSALACIESAQSSKAITEECLR